MKNLLLLFSFLICANGLFAQTENFWTKKANFGAIDTTVTLGIKRERAIAFSIGDYGYVGTGVDTAEIVHRDLWRFDPIADTWTQMADNPGSIRRNAVAFTIDDYGYVGTGMDSVNASAPLAQTLSDFWQYNPASNTWVQKASFPGGFGLGIYFATGFAIDSKGYICCGKMGPNQYSNQLWEYKATLDQWTQLPSFPGGVRYQLSSFVIGFKAYVGLGTDQDIYRKDIWEFNAATNQWTAKMDFPASARSAAMTFTLGQRGYVCGGTNGGVLDDLWEYNPYNDDWSVRATYGGSPRKGGVGFAINNKGYVGLGKGVSGKKRSMHEYTPPAILSINENEIAFNIFPNPAADILNIKSESNQVEQFEIYSSYGSKVLSLESEGKINIQNLQSGVYFIAALDRDKNIISKKKLLIQ